MFLKRSRRHKDNENRLRGLHGREIKYVSRRDPHDYGETIIGKDGVINITDDELVIICGGRTVFRHTLTDLTGAELMSLDGINLRYCKGDQQEKHTIIAYYKYHRK